MSCLHQRRVRTERRAPSSPQSRSSCSHQGGSSTRRTVAGRLHTTIKHKAGCLDSNPFPSPLPPHFLLEALLNWHRFFPGSKPKLLPKCFHSVSPAAAFTVAQHTRGGGGAVGLSAVTRDAEEMRLSYRSTASSEARSQTGRPLSAGGSGPSGRQRGFLLPGSRNAPPASCSASEVLKTSHSTFHPESDTRKNS